MNDISPKKTPQVVPAHHSKVPFVAKLVMLMLLGALIFVAVAYRLLRSELVQVRSAAASSTAAYEAKVVQLSTDLATTQGDNDSLAHELRAEKRRNGDFSDQIEELAGTISVLDKLRKTDVELLKKYSKISFLNENYIPGSLSAIDKDFLSTSVSEQRIHTGTAPFLQNMLEAAKRANNEVRVVSAYRSFGTQAALKSGYTVVYGTGANKFSADQGYSEHQLGTTVDFSTLALKGVLDGFDKTAAYLWLQKNAYRYGFILSYPAGNAYYQFEPWHWRFVGVELATDLHDAKKNFYDMDQRAIDAYLVKIFD